MILAFLVDLFSEESEVPFGRARVGLEEELTRCKELGIWDTEMSAGAYLNLWIRNGWLRELDDQLMKTDACDVAIRFAHGLEQRETGTSASRLRIVQEAVRDFAVAISPNVGERVNLLEYKKAAIQREIDALNAGQVSHLSDLEQRERMREIYQLASALTGDFRRVEDDLRALDQNLRVQMIEDGTKRGELLRGVFEKEALVLRTDAGSAFEGFFQLLCDQNRSMELREQLRGILSRPAADHLSAQQRKYLSSLMRELSRESDRVIRIRRRTEESLRAYIESNAIMERRAVDRLLQQLEKAAVELKDGGVDVKTETRLALPVGAIKMTSPDAIRLKLPDEKLDTSDVEEAVNSRSLNASMLDHLDAVQIRDVALKARSALASDGPMTIGNIVEKLPVTGIEELVAYLRIAKAVGATSLEQTASGTETVEFLDRSGVRLKATIPTLIMSAELFPDSIDELSI